MRITISSTANKTLAATPKKWGPDHPMYERYKLHPDASIFKLANKIDILTHPNVSKKTKSPGRRAPLHLAATNFKEALNHPDVARVKDMYGNTPLHFAAGRFKEALDHPDVAGVKNKYGSTPLHWAAMHFPKLVLKHPMSKKVKNKKGQTPYDIVNRME